MAPILHRPRHPLLFSRFGIPAAASATLLDRGFRTAAGAGAIRRRRRSLLQPADPAAQRLGRDGDDLRRPQRRLAGGGGRVAVRWPTRSSRSCARTGAGPRRRAGERPGGAPLRRRRRLDLAPGARRRHRRGTAAAPRRPRLPPLPARARRLQARPGRRGRGAMDRRTAAVPAPCTWSGPSRRWSRAEREVNRGRHARAAIRPASASSTWPIPSARPATCTRCGPTPTCRTATPAMPSAAILDQIERFAPGTARAHRGPRRALPGQFEAENLNYVGGDIIYGANTPWQMPIRPRLAFDPYRRACPASTSARRRRRQAAGCTAWAATTRRSRCCARSAERRVRERHAPLNGTLTARGAAPARMP